MIARSIVARARETPDLAETQARSRLPQSVKQINSVEFNRARSVLATTEGLFEVDVQEMPNMVRATSMPRQIVHTQLLEGFRVARYIEDPFVLGEHPAMAIIAKTKGEKKCVFVDEQISLLLQR